MPQHHNPRPDRNLSVPFNVETVTVSPSPTMSPNQEAVTTAIAVLLSTTPETRLGQLLKVCLAAKVNGEVQAKAQELFQDTGNLAHWLQDVIGDDGQYTPDEWQALGEIDLLDNVEKFVEGLLAEVEAL